MTSTAYASILNWSPEDPLLGSQVGSPAPADRLLAAEMAVLTDQGISPARAAQAIGVQGAIARTGLVQQVEAALGGAFAGVWFDASQARLHIGVTSTASRRLAKAVVARAGLSASVVETPVRSTWAQLLATQARWRSKLKNRLPRGQTETALHPQTNTVSVELSSSIPARERRTMEREASSSAANVVVGTVPASQLQATRQQGTSCSHFLEDKANCNKTLTAGVVVEGEKICTAGPLVMPQGSNKSDTYILTAGHCVIEVGEAISAFDRAGNKLEIGKVVNEVDGEAGDYAAIRIENAAWKNAGKAPLLAVTAEWNTTDNRSYPVIGERHPVQGATNCHEGISTGHSCGLIEAVNVDVEIEGSVVKNLVKDSGPSLKAANGDSGGPWMFIDTAKNAVMEGTHVSSGENGSSYEPLLTILSSLKLELLTTANEARDQLGEFNAGTGKLLARALGTQVLTTLVGSIECSSLKLTEGEASSKALRLTVEYQNCKVFGAAATVSLAQYALQSPGSLDLLNTVTVKATLCTITIPSAKNQGLRTIKYDNVGKELLTLSRVSRITSSGAGVGCPYAEESKGTFEGNSIIGTEGGTLHWE
ncbi:MAG TPA: trypsin-like serine protease [Solirubrobacteraceae bacterium]|nr:trypsin-like serine protease [Solirubrobacteraceae bacterium]